MPRHLLLQGQSETLVNLFLFSVPHPAADCHDKESRGIDCMTLVVLYCLFPVLPTANAFVMTLYVISYFVCQNVDLLSHNCDYS